MRSSGRLLLGALVSSLAACILTTSFDGYDALAPRVEPGGGGDAGLLGDACTSLIPAPPATQDGEDEKEYVLAVNAVRFERLPEAGPPEAPVGFNLDGTCTCPGPASCALAPLPGKERCDDPGGRDNVAVAIFTDLSKLSLEAFQPSFARDAIARGRYTMLFKLQDYNGTRNDRKVIVSFYLSSGIEGIQAIDDGGTPAPPRFDGTDVWTVDPRSLASVGEGGVTCATAGACVPRFVDTEAYVSDGKLVAHLSLPISLPGPTSSLTLDLREGALVGELSRNGTGFAFAGDYGGRSGVGQILAGLAFLRDPQMNFICRGNNYYNLAKQKLCASVDLMSERRQDGMGLRCNALSAAIALEARPARLGSVWRPPEAKVGCPGDVDAGLDTCD